jgi:hypothetical protein
MPASTFQITVQSTATLVFLRNPLRREVIVYNNSLVVVELVHEKGGAFGQGQPIPAGQVWSDDVDQEDIYLIVSTGTADCRVTEISEAE